MFSNLFPKRQERKMSTRNFVTEMTSEGRLDAGLYKCDLSYTNPVNQEVLTKDFAKRIEQFANQSNGKIESRTTNTPTPNIVLYEDVYQFVNLESMAFFAQQVGYIRTTRAINFRVDYDSLKALL